MSDKIWELCREKDYLVQAASEFLDEHTAGDGTLSAKDAAEYERMERQIQNVKDNIERHTRLQLSASYDGGQRDRAILGQPGANPFSGDYSIRQSGGIHGDDYRKNFLNAIRKNFKDDATSYLREGALVDGGYLLPVEMHNEIITKLESENVLRQISRVITTASEHKISILTSAPTASWLGEGEEIPLSNAQFGQTSLNAYKLAVNLKISNELLQDSYYNLEDFIITEFSKSLGRAEEESFITGAPDVSGNTKQPTGILTTLNQSATGTIQTVASEISADDILSLYYSVDRAYRKSAVFLASDATIAALRKLKDNTQNYIWQPSLQEGEPPRIFGTPIYSSNFMPAPASGNIALIFGDFRNFFLIGERGNRVFKPLRELFATSDQTGFLMIERIDCAVADRNAFRGLKIR